MVIFRHLRTTQHIVVAEYNLFDEQISLSSCFRAWDDLPIFDLRYSLEIDQR